MTSDASRNDMSQIGQLIDSAKEAERFERYDEAVETFKSALSRYQENGDIGGQVYSLKKLGELHQKLSKAQYDQALDLLATNTGIPFTSDDSGTGLTGATLPINGTDDPGPGISNPEPLPLNPNPDPPSGT